MRSDPQHIEVDEKFLGYGHENNLLQNKRAGLHHVSAALR